MKIKITKSKLKEIVKEEAIKFKRVLELKKELDEIEQQLNEVKAGAPIEKGGDGVHAGQRKAVFATKNGNPDLKMEDGIEDIDADETIPVEDGEEGIEATNDDLATSELGGDTISKADVASAIEDLEIKLGLHAGAGDGEGEEGEEEFEFDASEELPSEEEPVADDEAGAEEETMEEYTDEHPVTTTDAVGQMSVGEKKADGDEDAVTENLDEPIEGHSVAQVAKDSTVDDGMEKDKHVKEGEEKEVVKDTIAEAEKKRMALLAGIIKG
jgi:hypothetical protein